MDRLNELFEKYRNNTCSPEEMEELWGYFRSGQDEDRLKVLIDGALGREAKVDKEIKAQADEVYNTLLTHIHFEEPMQKRVWSPGRWAIAASVLLLVSVGSYFLLHKKQPVQLAQNDVAPFSKQAILKTGYGKTLQLDSTHKGLLAQYANTRISTTNNAVTYTNNSTTETATVFDTLQVPAGGKPYHLKLADGSAVTVNVASALRFPENFRNGNNEVELISGEAYFSIIHNVNAMLTIKAKDQTIRDYGTEFDVNTYNDEPDSRTTLVEGSVKVNDKLLIPGQQAIIAGSSLTVVKANIGQVTAWIKGYFRFNGEDIQTVMRELARWYNIEVKYEGKISKEGYYLKITRSMKISEVLRVLERTNSVHFKIEGRRITVYGKK